MANGETMMDERGRVTIGKKRSAKYGKKFFVIYMPNEIVLIPRPEDPVKNLVEWGKKINFGPITAEKINKLTEEETYKDIAQELGLMKKGRHKR